MSTKHSKAAEKVNRNPEWVTRHDKTFWSVRAKRDDQAHGLKEWEQLREAASQIKKHTVTHLADYLEQFEQNAIKNGAIVHWAKDADNILTAEMEDNLDFVLEGGAIESDGEGTIFTTSGCLMAPHRNQPLTRDEIEQQLKERLCANRVMWIEHGNLIGDDTDGHIDTLVRIAPNDTLLYVGCDDPEDVHYEPLKAMEEELKQWRTAENRAYRLLKLPLPLPIIRNGERLPATYANYLVINGVVLCPVYGQTENDVQALKQIKKAYPEREVVPIDCCSIIVQHGSLHCCTMQYYG